jgi:hypothetical protein
VREATCYGRRAENGQNRSRRHGGFVRFGGRHFAGAKYWQAAGQVMGMGSDVECAAIKFPHPE